MRPGRIRVRAFAARDASIVSASGNFDPSTSFALSSTAYEVAADTTYTLNSPSGDLVSGGTILATPQAGETAPDGGADDRVLGDVVGTASSSVTLGLSNGVCSLQFNSTFVLLNAATDNSAANVIMPSSLAESDSGGHNSPLFHDVNIISTPPGNADGGSEPPSAVSPANGLPGHVDRYPAYLNTVFDPDTPSGPLSPVAPLARYSGGQLIAGQNRS